MRPTRFVKHVVVLFVSVLALGLSARVSAGNSCTGLEAVFFDLGDTLVEFNSSSGLFELRPGAATTVDQLQALGVRLGIITNVPSTWDRSDLEAVLEEPEFLDEFEVLVLSSQAPASKPDPAIYLFAHDMLSGGVTITRTAFVGETLGEIADAEPPTEGARAVGMVGIHLSDAAPSPLSDYTLQTNNLAGVVGIAEDHGLPVFCDDFETGDAGAWVQVPAP